MKKNTSTRVIAFLIGIDDDRLQEIKRFVAYERMQDDLKRSKISHQIDDHPYPTAGFCLSILRCNIWTNYDDAPVRKFPELMKYEPEVCEDCSWWFDRYDFDHRIEILVSIMKKMRSSFGLRDEAVLRLVRTEPCLKIETRTLEESEA